MTVNRGKPSREAAYPAIKAAIASLLHGCNSPLRCDAAARLTCWLISCAQHVLQTPASSTTCVLHGRWHSDWSCPAIIQAESMLFVHCSGSAVTMSTVGCRLFNVPAGCKLEAAAPEMADWLQSPALETALAPYNKGDVLRGGLHTVRHVSCCASPGCCCVVLGMQAGGHKCLCTSYLPSSRELILPGMAQRLSAHTQHTTVMPSEVPRLSLLPGLVQVWTRVSS